MEMKAINRVILLLISIIFIGNITDAQEDQTSTVVPSPEPAELTEPDRLTEEAESPEVTPPEEEAEFLEIKTPEEEEIVGAEAKPSPNGVNLISIMLDDVPLEDVVRMFTRISGANIIATATNLEGRTVTVNLTDVEWKPALNSILDMHSLALVEKTPGSGVYSIVPKVPDAPEPMLVETFFLKYATVSNIHPVISSMLVQGGTVSPFAARNALIVRSTQANLGEIKQIIENIDKLRDQVFIEAKFLELNEDAIKDLGINWQVLQGYSIGAGNLNWNMGEDRKWTESRSDKLSQWDKRKMGDAVNERYDIDGQQYEETTTTYEESPPDSGNWVANTVITPTRTITDEIDKGKDITSEIEDAFSKTVTDIRTAVLGADDFRLILSAFKQMGGVTIVSNPKIIVANEESATIHIGQTERPFIATVTPGTESSAPFTTYNPGDPVDFGVKLTVTPTVNTESNITVRIEPELTRFVKNAVAPNGQTYPIIATKKIRTIFCLENGKTVAIGGLTETSEDDVTSKIPLLGDIPLIGKYLFSHTHKEKSQQETIIFVTMGLAMPHAIKKEAGLPEDTELTRRHIIRSEVKKQELQKELENEKTKEATQAESIENPKKRRFWFFGFGRE